MTGFRLECFRYGFIGRAEAHPLRKVQALLRARAAETEAIERAEILSEIREIVVDKSRLLD